MQRVTFHLIGFTLFFLSSILPAHGITINNCVEGDGKTKTESRIVSGFSQLTADGALDIQITCGQKELIKVTADGNLLPFIRTQVQGSMLTIDTGKPICTKSDIRVVISVPDLSHIHTSGAIDISVKNISNSAFALEADGAGDIVLQGKTNELNVNLEGSSDLKARELIAESAVITMDGAGDAGVHAIQSLKATINGAGEITYFGHPKTISHKINGAGEIISADGDAIGKAAQDDEPDDEDMDE